MIEIVAILSVTDSNVKGISNLLGQLVFILCLNARQKKKNQYLDEIIFGL